MRRMLRRSGFCLKKVMNEISGDRYDITIYEKCTIYIFIYSHIATITYSIYYKHTWIGVRKKPTTTKPSEREKKTLKIDLVARQISRAKMLFVFETYCFCLYRSSRQSSRCATFIIHNRFFFPLHSLWMFALLVRVWEHGHWSMSMAFA